MIKLKSIKQNYKICYCYVTNINVNQLLGGKKK